MDITLSLLAIFGFLLLSAFFSGSETAFFSLNLIQLKKIEKGRTGSSRRIYRLLKKPRQLLIIILLGNTIVNVAASSTAAIIAFKVGERYFRIEQQPILMLVEIIIMTLLLLLFGEVTPKLLAYSSPEKTASFSSFLLEIIKYALWPIIKILDLISSLFSKPPSHENNTEITTEDFRNLISSKVTQTPFEENEKKIIASIFRFYSTLAKDIMIPRVDMIAIDASEGMNRLRETIITSGHSKIPIFKKNIDNIIGIVYAKDVILHQEKNTVNSLLRPCLFITGNVKIQNLLNQFKSKKVQIAVVVDEYGGTSGLITLEDILEELVGEIMDEYDTEQPMISKTKEGEYLINGMLTIAELNHEFYLDLDEEYDNIAEFLYDNLNRVPHKNESYIYNKKIRFTITDLDGQRINYVKMTLLDKESHSED